MKKLARKPGGQFRDCLSSGARRRLTIALTASVSCLLAVGSERATTILEDASGGFGAPLTKTPSRMSTRRVVAVGLPVRTDQANSTIQSAAQLKRPRISTGAVGFARVLPQLPVDHGIR